MNSFDRLLKFLKDSLTGKGFTILCATDTNSHELPDLGGIKPDLVASYKGVKTIYGIVELPENAITQEQWDRVRTLSDDPGRELYIVFPEGEKLKLVLSLLNGKLAERKNIIRLYADI